MVSPEYRKRELKPLNDRFCLAEACLVADVVQHLQDAAGNKAFHPRCVSYVLYLQCGSFVYFMGGQSRDIDVQRSFVRFEDETKKV